MNRLFLLDAMALIYRAYFALNKNPRINSKGMNTSAVMGFSNTLYDLLRSEKPTHLGVAFDTMAPTARHLEFTAYKANREALPEDIGIALPYIKQIIRAFNIPVLYADGYEADDVVGTLAKQAETKGYEVYMMTSDKDFGQLVSDRVFIYKPGKMGEKPEKLGIQEVCDKFKVKRTEQIIDLLGLMGDASDNIPGVPGVGPVTAQKLLQEYDTVENVIANAHRIPNEKLREKITTHAEQALMSKQLATILLDAPVEFDEKALAVRSPDKQALKEILEELELRAFAKRVFTDLSLEASAAPAAQGDLFSEHPEAGGARSFRTLEEVPHAYHLVIGREGLEPLLARLSSCKSFCFDTETTGIDPHSAELVGISFAFTPGEAWFVRMPENYAETIEELKVFKPFLEDAKTEKCGQNLKYDIAVLRWYDIEVKGALFDTMIAHYLLQPDMRHNMDLLAETYLMYKPVPIESLIGKKGKDQGNMRQVESGLLKEYACEDADITLQLRETFEPMLEEAGVRQLFDRIEAPLIPVLAAIEAEGIKVDKNILSDYSEQLRNEIQTLNREILELAGMTFNIASPKQLGEVLFDHLKIAEKPRQTSKTGQYSTGEDVLQKLVNRHPIIQKILDYRSLAKLKSTYVDTLPSMINPRTGRVHSTFNQAVAATGRLSSNNPNLQNIPIRTERGREIRKAFLPRNGEYLLLSADYSQIELRIIAELSNDSGMIEAFRLGQDIHTATAAKVYGLKPEEVTKDMRRNAKSVNFGIIYGSSAFGLSEQLGISRKEAAGIIEQYFAQYPGIKKYMEDSIAFARANGYVETMMKRRRYLRDILSNNSVVRGFAERNAINAPIQGSAADMIKIAMISIHKEMNKLGMRSKMILQVHDELVFDAYREELDVLKPLVEGLMRTALPMRVPVVVELETGENWLEAH